MLLLPPFIKMSTIFLCCCFAVSVSSKRHIFAKALFFLFQLNSIKQRHFIILCIFPCIFCIFNALFIIRREERNIFFQIGWWNLFCFSLFSSVAVALFTFFCFYRTFLCHLKCKQIVASFFREIFWLKT